jgi:hypothetical protein
MVTKVEIKNKAVVAKATLPVNNRLSYCRYCGEPIFKIRVELEELGWRSWWHELDELDIEHFAKPDGRVRYE